MKVNDRSQRNLEIIYNPTNIECSLLTIINIRRDYGKSVESMHTWLEYAGDEP